MICDECNGQGCVGARCSACNGSGEGMYDGTRCHTCRGFGEVTVECPHCHGNRVVDDDDDE